MLGTSFARSEYWSKNLAGLTLTALIARAVAFLFGFGIHEASHAWVAYLLGDDTAQRHGRLTLNPLRHLDPLGYILAIIVGIGWAKPTPVNPWRLRFGSRVGNALVAAAGPISNLLMAVVIAVPWRLGVFDALPPLARSVVGIFIWANVALFLFNLIPLAPLDGISVLSGIVGPSGAAALAPLRNYGPQILMGLLLIGYILPMLDILGRTLFPAINALAGLLLG
jgi:Zn-dependent protease